MATRIDRSMNDEMRFGALDGRVRFLRPDSANAEMEPAVARSHVLHAQSFGSMGVPGSLQALADYLPGAVSPLHPERVSRREVVDPVLVQSPATW